MSTQRICKVNVQGVEFSALYVEKVNFTYQGMKGLGHRIKLLMSSLRLSKAIKEPCFKGRELIVGDTEIKQIFKH